MTISTSGFFEYYKKLDQQMEQLGTPESTSHDKIYDLMKQNLATIALFSGKSKEGFFSFSNDGQIVVDRWSARGFRSAIKAHIIRYSKYSDDMKRDLVKFTQFVNDYLKVHSNHIESQRALVLQTMLKQAVSHLEDLQESYSRQGLKDDVQSITQSRAKLNKALSTLNQAITKSKGIAPHQKTENYIDLIKNSDLSNKDKVILLKNKLESIKTPSISIDKSEIEEKQLVIKKYEDLVKDKNDQITALLSSTNISPTEREGKIKVLAKEKQEIQANREYLSAKEFVLGYKSYVDQFTQEYNSIFSETPNSIYKEFVDNLVCYKNAEDRAFLLASLLLKKPSREDLATLKKSIEEIGQSETKSSAEIKRIQKQEVKQSGLFDEAIDLISERKKAKRAEFETRASEESKRWLLGKAAANFVAAGGIVTLSFFFPYAAAGYSYVPSLLKSSYQGVKRAWDGKTQVEQNAIKEDLKKFIQGVREDPAKALETAQSQYKTKGTTGKEMLTFVNKVVELSQDPANAGVLDEFLVSA